MIRGPPASRRVLKPLHPSATPARSTPELFLPERTPGVNELKERLGKGLSGSRVPPESGSIPPAPRGEDLPARSGHGKRRGPAFVSVFLPFPPSPLARSLGGRFVCRARGISGGRMGQCRCRRRRDLQEEEGPRSRRHAGRGRGFRANPDPASASRWRAPSPNRPESQEKGLGDEEAAARGCPGLGGCSVSDAEPAAEVGSPCPPPAWGARDGDREWDRE